METNIPNSDNLVDPEHVQSSLQESLKSLQRTALPTTTKGKLRLLLGLYSFILLLTVGISVHQNIQVKSHVVVLTDVEEPMEKAILEMEINVAETARAALDYIRDHEAHDIQKMRDSQRDFERYISQFTYLVTTAEELELVAQVATLWREFKVLGADITAISKRRHQSLQVFRTDVLDIEGLIDSELQPASDRFGANAFSKQEAALEMEIDIHEAFGAIEGYVLGPDPALMQEIADSEANFERFEAQYRAAALSRDEKTILALVKSDFTEAVAAGNRIVAMTDRLNEKLERFEVILEEIDEILDEQIQPLILAETRYAAAAAKRSASVAITVVGGMAFLSIIVGWRLATLLTRSIMQSEARIEELAYYDDLTGLGNRTSLRQRIIQSMRVARRRKQKFAVLFFDLDSFKDINDSLGHPAGDELLWVVSERLQSVLREMDFAARLGGDEFCVLIEDIADDCAAARVATKCLQAIAEPVVIAGRNLQPRASVGITLFPQNGQDFDSLLQTADSAMYVAKSAGKQGYAFYTSDLTLEAERRMTLEHDLRRSIQLGEFELHYQPQVDLESGRLVGVEALIRWNHPTRGMVPPNEFISVAERIGLIEELGNWVLQRACQQAVVWRKAGLPSFRVAVNISGLHFLDGKIVNAVQDVLQETGFEPTQLEVEITESAVQTGEHSMETFKRLRALGVKIAIDDFGTGYSCLASLKQLPVDCLKIDQSFLHNLLDDPDYSTIVATIIGMGRAMRLTVVAEGVESIEQVQYLCALGCNVVQGYFFSKPVPARQIPKLATTNFLPKSPASAIVALPTG